jgi:hypothetical protein
MWLFFIFLGIGIAIGFSNRIPEKYIKYNTWFQRIGIVLLLFSMGASIGSNKKMISEIQFIGVKSLSFALAACIFSVLFTFLLTRKFLGDKKQ